MEVKSLCHGKEYINIVIVQHFTLYFCRFSEHPGCGYVNSLVNTAKSNYFNTTWENKYNKVVWRGSPYMPHKFDAADPPVRHYPRYYASLLSLTNNHWLDACITGADGDWYMARVYWKNVSCSDRNKDRMEIPDIVKHKYILHIGGTSGTSSAILWKLASSSVVMYVKSDFKDWYDPLLVPWQHYVPIASDLNDLEKNYRYLESHPHIALDIMKNGNEIAEFINNYSFKKLEFSQMLLKRHLIRNYD